MKILSICIIWSIAAASVVDKSSDNPGECSAKAVIRRFPRYGTEQYEHICPWIDAEPTTDEGATCTFYVRPIPTSGEGLAEWVSMVAMGYIYSRQVGCQFVTDYGPSVELDKVYTPPVGTWIVPRGFECREEDGCYDIGSKTIGGIPPDQLRKIASRHNPDILSHRTTTFASIPNYRMSYSRSDNVTGAIEELKNVLPGFTYETGFACAFLFELAPSAADYMPGIFTNVLDHVRDPDVLVITVYIRTGRTDRVASLEKGDKISDDGHNVIQSSSFDENLVKCAMKVERERFDTSLHSTIAWLVVTDAPNVASEVASLYSGKQELVLAGRTIPRKVVTTQSSGIQSRPSRDPSTSDFADAAVDWYLIGESDAVISHGITSFATTGALRTARPLYTAMKGECKHRYLDHDGTAIVDGYVQAAIKPGQKLNLVQLVKDQQRRKREKAQQTK